MIKSEHRLRKNKHFQYIYRHGHSRQVRAMTVVFAKTHLKPFKAGFSVTKKVGKSVVRSRVKRLMTEAFNRLQAGMHTGYNYVFSAKPEIVGLSLEEVTREMKACLVKAGLYSE